MRRARLPPRASPTWRASRTRSFSRRTTCRPSCARSRVKSWPRCRAPRSEVVNGYGNRLLFVDLTTGATRVEPLGETSARALLGGNGLAARILLDRVPAGIDAFDPENAVVFAVGPITDTTVPGNSRALAATKSPLTGLFFDSTFGGRFPATLKRTGFDAVCLTGRAPRPSYVLVTEDGAVVKSAA